MKYAEATFAANMQKKNMPKTKIKFVRKENSGPEGLPNPPAGIAIGFTLSI